MRQRKRNRFLNAKRDGTSYKMKPDAQSHAVAYRRGPKAVEARCVNCENASR
jgi:hypothetical protein